MGLAQWYDAHIMPRLVKLACAQGQVMKWRAEIVPRAQGDVFELGCGGGLNLQFYREEAVRSLAGVDPHPLLLEDARKAAGDKRWRLDLRLGKGEDIPFPDSQFDCAVCTFTLCSVEDHERVLGELRRVLKPGGQLLFLEHGRAPDPRIARWQERVEPVWKRLAGGCHLTRPIGSALRGAGFDVEPLGQGYMPKAPRIAGWVEWGVARKPGP